VGKPFKQTNHAENSYGGSVFENRSFFIAPYLAASGVPVLCLRGAKSTYEAGKVLCSADSFFNFVALYP
jgi:hypothetical protein